MAALWELLVYDPYTDTYNLVAVGGKEVLEKKRADMPGIDSRRFIVRERTP